MKFNELKCSLKEVLSTQATSYDYEDTVGYLIDKCYELGASNVEIDAHDNLYVTKGIAKVYPCVVSHTDTVHDIYKGYKVYEVNGSFVAYDLESMQQVGTGGDDKVGIWVCLEMLRKFDNIKICFFAQEEIGCVGSSKADEEFFKDVGYVFECDRKGSSDFVQTSSNVKMFGDAFKKLIAPTLKTYNYSITDGGLTDVHEISQIANICCANMSCGYYKPHTKQEYVKIDEAINTMKLVGALITSLGEVKHTHEAVNEYQSWGYGTYNSYGASGYGNVAQQNNWYSSKPKKAGLISTLISKVNDFKGCDLCGEISTQGCEFCEDVNTPTVDTLPEKVNYSGRASVKCSCGQTLRVYGSGVDEYSHCYDCGYYEDATKLPF